MKNKLPKVSDSGEQSEETRKVSDWMQKFAAQTPNPSNLPAPGLILFKARLLEKQSAAERAAQPIVRAQIASAFIFGTAICWLMFTGKTAVGAFFAETFRSLLNFAPLILLSAAGAGLICLTFFYFLRDTKELEK